MLLDCLSYIRTIGNDLLDIFMPRICHVCDRVIEGQGRVLCLECQAKLARCQASTDGNLAEQRLWGHFPIEKATAFCFYEKSGTFAQLIHDAKYNQKPYVNYELGTLFGNELKASSWQEGIDCIIPVPVHWRRRMKRGYNQTEDLARALSDCWHKPYITDVLYKKHYTTSQVQNSYQERYDNIVDSFGCRHPEKVKNKHILIVDDVLTSGATIDACAHVLLQIEGVKISFLTLGLAI